MNGRSVSPCTKLSTEIVHRPFPVAIAFCMRFSPSSSTLPLSSSSSFLLFALVDFLLVFVCCLCLVFLIGHYRFAQGNIGSDTESGNTRSSTAAAAPSPCRHSLSLLIDRSVTVIESAAAAAVRLLLLFSFYAPNPILIPLTILVSVHFIFREPDPARRLHRTPTTA